MQIYVFALVISHRNVCGWGEAEEAESKEQALDKSELVERSRAYCNRGIEVKQNTAAKTQVWN
jgi:hypothetical protein